MTLLLDTHAVLWWLMADAAGRLRLPKPPADLLSERGLEGAGFQSMGIRAAHALIAGALPPYHRDPFDRMLVAQAQLEDLMIVTSDAAFEAYDVKLLDARA